ncbi:DUF3040 domain-containing protein [Pseudonocardia sp.]|uniref:DUF3040 domain-containing protein n=1 Tax=Pseudonocardia sp. TaxID=60912 RepID=UPI0026151BD5|nr:DUF3040 domain-containing protein [Pseudonocardia sp.]
MNSPDERRVLDGIESGLRATDPDLCDRLAGVARPAGPAAIRHRLTSTSSIIGYVAVLAGALLFGIVGLVTLMLLAIVVSTSVRSMRNRPEEQPDTSAGPPPRRMPPFDTG